MIDSGRTATTSFEKSPGEMMTTDEQEGLLHAIATVRDELRKIIRGKDDVVDLVLTSVLSQGSVLLEDVPGVGKTTLAKSWLRSSILSSTEFSARPICCRRISWAVRSTSLPAVNSSSDPALCFATC